MKVGAQVTALTRIVPAKGTLMIPSDVGAVDVTLLTRNVNCPPLKAKT